MILYINDEQTIDEVREKFNDCFPYLKIEFYIHPHNWYEPSKEKKQLDPAQRMGDIRKKHVQGPFEIFSYFRTGDLEQLFKEKFGLNVQVFRLHGGEWIQTVGTDKLTLKEQNEIGQRTASEQHEADSKTERENLF